MSDPAPLPPRKKSEHTMARIVYALVFFSFIGLCTVAVLTTMDIDKNKKGFKPITVKQPISFIDNTYMAQKTSDPAIGNAQPTVPIANQLANAGLQQVSPAQLQALVSPANTARVLVFSSKFCLDCQAMAPVLAKLEKQYPTIKATHLDVAKDKDSHYPLFEAFRPTTVPAVIFIAPNGTIRRAFGDTLTLKNMEPELKAGFDALLPSG